MSGEDSRDYESAGPAREGDAQILPAHWGDHERGCKEAAAPQVLSPVLSRSRDKLSDACDWGLLVLNFVPLL